MVPPYDTTYNSPFASSPKLAGDEAAAPSSEVCSRKSLAVASPVETLTVSAIDQMRLETKSPNT